MIIIFSKIISKLFFYVNIFHVKDERSLPFSTCVPKIATYLFSISEIWHHYDLVQNFVTFDPELGTVSRVHFM